MQTLPFPMASRLTFDGPVYLAIDGDVFVYYRFARDRASFVSLPVAQQLVFDRSKTGCTLLERTPTAESVWGGGVHKTSGT